MGPLQNINGTSPTTESDFRGFKTKVFIPFMCAAWSAQELFLWVESWSKVHLTVKISIVSPNSCCTIPRTDARTQCYSDQTWRMHSMIRNGFSEPMQKTVHAVRKQVGWCNDWSILCKPVHQPLTVHQQRCHQVGERWQFPAPVPCTRMQPEMQSKAERAASAKTIPYSLPTTTR